MSGRSRLPGSSSRRDAARIVAERVVATVAGVAVAVDEVDAAEARLRDGPRAAALPASGTSEGRQLRRWLTQLIVTERVVAAEAAARGLTAAGAPAEADLLPDATARLEIGSVAAAVLADPLARALFAAVTARSRSPTTPWPTTMPATRCGSPRHVPASTAGVPRRRPPHRWIRCAARSPSICWGPRAAAPSGCGWTRAGTPGGAGPRL